VSDLIGTGVAFPLQADHRGALAVAHGVSDIEQAIRVILGTAPGERPMRPEFGCDVHDVVFDTIDAATIGRVGSAVQRALDRWEPRIVVLSVDFDLSEVDAGKLLIAITYQVRATTAQHNLVYPFYVIPAEEFE
jgi:phage baseplate assembly protein W